MCVGAVVFVFHFGLIFAWTRTPRWVREREGMGWLLVAVWWLAAAAVPYSILGALDWL